MSRSAAQDIRSSGAGERKRSAGEENGGGAKVVAGQVPQIAASKPAFFSLEDVPAIAFPASPKPRISPLAARQYQLLDLQHALHCSR